MQKTAALFIAFCIFSLASGMIQGFFRAFLEDRWKKKKKNEELLETALNRAEEIVHTLERKIDLLEAKIQETRTKE